MGADKFNTRGDATMDYNLNPAGSRKTHNRFMFLKPEMRAGLMSHLV